jgi:hypothetical protein
MPLPMIHSNYLVIQAAPLRPNVAHVATFFQCRLLLSLERPTPSFALVDTVTM